MNWNEPASRKAIATVVAPLVFVGAVILSTIVISLLVQMNPVEFALAGAMSWLATQTARSELPYQVYAYARLWGVTLLGSGALAFFIGYLIWPKER